MNSRVIKIAFSGAVGVYISLICLNNILDYSSNFSFVSMIAKMDDTFSKESNGWRSVNSSLWHHAMFLFIILWELTIAFFVWLGFFKMIRNFRSTTIDFKKAKKYTSIGLALGILLWFVVFISIAGEWFLMWQSKNWNAQTNGFFLTCCFLLFLVHHNQEDV